jgi:hypothetical protein
VEAKGREAAGANIEKYLKLYGLPEGYSFIT